MVTVGSILRGTFEFARTNILAILVWSGLLLVSGLVMGLTMMRPIYGAQLATLQTGVNTIPSLGAVSWLALAVTVILFLMVWGAVFRAIMLPAQTRFFYLRLGRDELNLLGLVLVLIVAALALEVVGVIGIILIGAVVSLVAGKIAGTVVAAIAGLVLFCVFVWAMVRIAPAGPLTILQGKIMIGPAWRLSRGHFWRMLGAFLVIALAVFAVYIVLMFVQMGPIMADMVRLGDPDAARRVAEWQLSRLQFGVSFVIYAIVASLIYGICLALQVGMSAVVTRELLRSAEPAPGAGPWG